MTERERLIKLVCRGLMKEGNNWKVENIADYLLQNGVIVPPCKVGDVVYMFNTNKSAIQKMIMDKVDIRCHCVKDDEFSCCMPICTDTDHNICEYRFKNDFSEFGKTVFLSREEAETALKAREKE